MMINKLSREEKLEIIHSKGANKRHILEILLDLQHKSIHSYIDKETITLVAEEIGISEKHIYELLTFYSMFETKPRGRFVLEVCCSTPCYYNKSVKIMQILEKELEIKAGETTEDNMFTLNYTPCVGACDIGPVIKIKDEVYGNLNEEKIKNLIVTLKAYDQKGNSLCLN